MTPMRSPFMVTDLGNEFFFSSPILCRRSLLRIDCSKKRTGKQRYPSEKKNNNKLLLGKRGTLPHIHDKLHGFWRLSNLNLPVHDDPGKDSFSLSPALLQRIADLLHYPVASMLPAQAFSVVRKSFDARKILKEPRFVYTVDMDADKLVELEPSTSDFLSHLEPKIGRVEYILQKLSGDLIGIIRDSKVIDEATIPENVRTVSVGQHKLDAVPKIAVVGSGPSGLFASLVLAELGAEVTLFERGQGVERRGRDIGSFVVRRILQLESNFCFGEGGAGTWSDGKLVTRIGRNSEGVLAVGKVSILGLAPASGIKGDSVYEYAMLPLQADNCEEFISLSRTHDHLVVSGLCCFGETKSKVMNTLVRFGAPENILVDGKPHLGTDRLVPLLRNFRQHLQQLGVSISFGSRVDDLLIEQGHVVGLKISDSRDWPPCPGQNASYDAVVLAVGHSARDVYQTLLSHNVELVPKDFSVGLRVEHPQELINTIQYSKLANEVQRGRGKVPVADYKVAKYVGNKENGAPSEAKECACYSFCMCPGGQVVLTSTDPSELCINGMSFSRRSSKWANAALVVTVSARDLDTGHGPLSGVYFQRELERKAALLGGGDFVVPVQTVTDFLDSKLSVTSMPPSSYRLGVKAASLHHLFSDHITEALQRSLCLFDKELPGFITEEALLHGVETRTSSPVQITRDAETYESTSLKGLYPIGEGAGYAGGIVSAAVDGMYAGLAVAKSFGLLPDGIESILGRAYGAGFGNY